MTRWHSPLWLLAASVATAACSDASGGASNEPDATAPEPQSYASSEFGMTTYDGRIVHFDFHGLGCDGPILPGGAASCESRLDGPLEVDVAVDAQGAFTYDGGFGLQLSGTIAPTGAAGTYNYVAPTDCCESAGSWTAAPGTAPQGGGNDDEPCDPGGQPSQAIVAGVTVEGAFSAIQPNTIIDAVPGIQGAIMVVATVRLEHVTLGSLTTRIDLEVPTARVTAAVVATGDAFVRHSDAEAEWADIWLVLEREDGELLNPFEPADVSAIDGAPAVIRVTAESTCGLTLQTEWIGALDYGPAVTE